MWSVLSVAAVNRIITPSLYPLSIRMPIRCLSGQTHSHSYPTNTQKTLSSSRPKCENDVDKVICCQLECRTSSRMMPDTHASSQKMHEEKQNTEKRPSPLSLTFHSQVSISKSDRFRTILYHKKNMKKILDAIPDPKVKYQTVVQNYLAYQDSRHKNSLVSYCDKCWLLSKQCICQFLRPVHVRHNYFVLLHHKEYWRGTNTGILLLNSCPTSKQLIMGIEKDDAELERLFAQESQRTVILFPSMDSIFIREYFERRAEKELSSAEKWIECIQNVKLNVIAVDATWNKARGLAAALPKHITRIRLEEPPKLSLSKMRKQGCAGRVTTAEGLAYLFKELHEDASTYQNLLYNLQVRCKAIDMSVGSNRSKDHLETEEKISRKEPLLTM